MLGANGERVCRKACGKEGMRAEGAERVMTPPYAKLVRKDRRNIKDVL
jgi:hypothetical protein